MMIILASMNCNGSYVCMIRNNDATIQRCIKFYEASFVAHGRPFGSCFWRPRQMNMQNFFLPTESKLNARSWLPCFHQQTYNGLHRTNSLVMYDYCEMKLKNAWYLRWLQPIIHLLLAIFPEFVHVYSIILLSISMA